MQVFDIRDSQDRATALQLCKNLIEKNVLIPVVGAGFSCGTSTDNRGKIPSATELNANLFGYIEAYSGYSREELDEIKVFKLSDTADIFWGIYDRIPDGVRDSHFLYFEKNFLDVSFFKGFQEAFLNVRWPYLFTLNYDSLIEDYKHRDYYSIIPFEHINSKFLSNKTRLYKLHGDAKRYIATGDEKYLILSGEQYVKSMLDSSNVDMLYELQTAFASKSVLFFGCGLDEELDLLYSSQLAISEKIKNLDPTHQAVIYISFEYGKEDKTVLSLRMKDKLSKYGITHVLRIFNEAQSESFFNELAEHSSQNPQLGIDSFLEKYSAMNYRLLSGGDIKSRDYMFQDNLVWNDFEEHIITLPNYCITRSPMKTVLDSIASREPVCFISGNFFSGKTFFLIELSRYFSTKKVYIFPSGTDLTDMQLDVLLTKEEALYCFDSKSLSTTQIKKLSQGGQLDRIRERRSCAIIVIDAYDAPMYKYIFEARNTSKGFPQIRISSAFDEKETYEFNRKLGEISFPPYSKGETLLDYIVRNENELLISSRTVNHFLQPHIQLLVRNPKERIKALVMLATEIRISARRAIQFKVDEYINDMIKYCLDSGGVPVIEKDYSVYSGDSSGYEFVCNSKYWIMRALSIYANAQVDSIDIIADSYQSIIRDYGTIYKNNDVEFYQQCEPYYFFDHIQLLFNQRWFPNSFKLMNEIYDKLLPHLSDSYQFLHQKAKGKLIIAQIQLKNSRVDGIETLKEALLNITRAIALAENFPNARNIKETILHMVYTKGRILIEYSRKFPRYTPRAVDTCYKLYKMQEDIKNDAYDFATGTGNDKEAFREFRYSLISNNNIRELDDFDAEKTEFLLNRWASAKFKITKKRREK